MNQSEQSGLIRSAIKHSLIDFNSSIPCIVLSVNKNIVSVRPAINIPRMTPDGEILYEIAERIENVRIAMLSTKKGYLRVPVSIGDNGYIIFSDRDLDNWTENLGDDPHTNRSHDINDCYYIPSFSAADENYNHDCTEIGYKNNWLKICDGGIKTNCDINIDGISFKKHKHRHSKPFTGTPF